MKLISISFFGVLGVLARYFMGILVGKTLPYLFPFGTFVINILGAFLIGIIYVLGIERAMMSPELRSGMMIGFLGGFTTFSSYCLETARLIEEAEYLYATLYFVLSPVVGLIALFGGLLLARGILGVQR